jgi:hypothetical protein
MPWSETNVSKERVRLVLEWEKRWNEGEGLVNLSELCREFGISRECGTGTGFNSAQPMSLRAQAVQAIPLTVDLRCRDMGDGAASSGLVTE